jgi:hypothetical protein
MKKYYIFTILVFIFNTLFAQEYFDNEHIKIPFLIIVNKEVFLDPEVTISIDTSEVNSLEFIKCTFDQNYIILNVPYEVGNIRFWKKDFDTLKIKNPKIKISITQFILNDYQTTLNIIGSFNDLINYDYNILELKVSDPSSIQYQYTNKNFIQKHKWHKKYSIIDFKYN